MSWNAAIFFTKYPCSLSRKIQQARNTRTIRIMHVWHRNAIRIFWKITKQHITLNAYAWRIISSIRKRLRPLQVVVAELHGSVRVLSEKWWNGDVLTLFWWCWYTTATRVSPRGNMILGSTVYKRNMKLSYYLVSSWVSVPRLLACTT